MGFQHYARVFGKAFRAAWARLRFSVLLAVMPLSTKRGLTLSAVECLITAIGFGEVHRFDVYRQATQREVGLESEPDYEGMNDDPISVLQSAIPKNRVAAKFRVRWSDVHPGLQVEGWLLYDRRKGTLQVDDSSCFPGKRDETICSESIHLFTNVTDGILTGLSPSVNLERLPKVLPMLGCPVHKIKDNSSVMHSP